MTTIPEASFKTVCGTVGRRMNVQQADAEDAAQDAIVFLLSKGENVNDFGPGWWIKTACGCAMNTRLKESRRRASLKWNAVDVMRRRPTERPDDIAARNEITVLVHKGAAESHGNRRFPLSDLFNAYDSRCQGTRENLMSRRETLKNNRLRRQNKDRLVAALGYLMDSV